MLLAGITKRGNIVPAARQHFWNRADDVPGWGYKVFSFVASTLAPSAPRPQPIQTVLENRNPGAEV
jgi:hypothetical protein